MQIETFEEQEIKEQTIEQAEECIALAEQLGLKGQKEFTNPEVKEQFPYRKATKEEAFVYDTLLPTSCDVEEYSDSAIPLRVLQVIAHAKSLGKFTRIEVQYAANADVKDPVVFAYIGDKYSRSQRFILARWGESLDSLTKMIPKAVKKFAARLKMKAMEQIDELKAGLKRLDEADDSVLLEEFQKDKWSRKILGMIDI